MHKKRPLLLLLFTALILLSRPNSALAQGTLNTKAQAKSKARKMEEKGKETKSEEKGKKSKTEEKGKKTYSMSFRWIGSLDLLTSMRFFPIRAYPL
jgi:hypothetical protein